MKPSIWAVFLHLQVCHCPYLFSFAEADIDKRTLHIRIRTPKPTQLLGLACLEAPEICVKRSASDAQVGERPSQYNLRVLENSSHLPVKVR